MTAAKPSSGSGSSLWPSTPSSLVVVAVLLTLILVTAKRIRAGVSAIWKVGQKVANNTIHLALLRSHQPHRRKDSAIAPGRRRGDWRHRSACRGAVPGVRTCVIGKGGRFR